MSKRLAIALIVLGFGWLAAACGQSGGPASDPVAAAADASLRAGEVAEATAIAQYVRSGPPEQEVLALATSLAQDGGLAGTTLPPPTGAVSLALSPTPRLPQETGEPAPIAPAEDRPALQVLSVGLAAEGDMIIVSFLALPAEAEAWGPGSISVVDEAGGIVYDEVPVMPEVGPLIGRPRQEGQMGYVLLANPPPGLQPAALVTVVLGAHRFEHVRVQ
jgi:hypothetical protein